MYVCMYVCIYVCMYVCMYMHVCVCVFVCVCVCVYVRRVSNVNPSLGMNSAFGVNFWSQPLDRNERLRLNRVSKPKKGGWLLCSHSRVNAAYLHLFFLSHTRALTLSLSLNSVGIRLSCHRRDWWSLALEIVPAFVSVSSVRRWPHLALFLSKSASNPKELPPPAISLHLALTVAFVLLRLALTMSTRNCR